MQSMAPEAVPAIGYGLAEMRNANGPTQLEVVEAPSFAQSFYPSTSVSNRDAFLVKSRLAS